jgi:hypothetical protein
VNDPAAGLVADLNGFNTSPSGFLFFENLDNMVLCKSSFLHTFSTLAILTIFPLLTVADLKETYNMYQSLKEAEFANRSQNDCWFRRF